MKILAIDTSCDESCVAIVDTATQRLLADVVHSHLGKMASYGGVVPEIASREHLKALPLAMTEALAVAKLTAREIDWVVVTSRPGLIGALLVGVAFAKALALSIEKPFSVLDHIEAHLFSPTLCRLEGKEPPKFPWVALVVSGGHTELFHVTSALHYKWLGGTLDDAAGEAFDKVGKMLGLPYPAGPVIDRIARESGNASAYDFPRAKLDGFDFSFSGLKTSIDTTRRKMSPEVLEQNKSNLVASAQEAILDPLVERARAAARDIEGATIVVTGGVACNSRLRDKLPEAYFPLPRHCSDNAAMVANLALLHEQAGSLVVAPWNASASPSSSILGNA